MIFDCDEYIITNARKKGDIKDATGSHFLELDFYIPHLKLAFEFQDAYHYGSSWFSKVKEKDIKRIDEFKKGSVNNKGDTLIEVPCWWDGQKESLISSIAEVRPELFNNEETSNSDLIIPLFPPAGFFDSEYIPGVGLLMQVALSIPSNAHNNNYWVSELYSGTRVCLTSTHLYSKSGQEIDHPIFSKYISSRYNNIFLDGVLWRGKEVASDGVELFHFLKCVVYDIPSLETCKLEYEERYTSILRIINIDDPIITVAPQMMKMEKTQIQSLIEYVDRSLSSSSFIFRRVNSNYKNGVAASLFKVPSGNITSVYEPSEHSKKPLGHWTIDESKNIKLYFDEFAKFNHFDSLIPDNWYSITHKQILQFKEGGSIITIYNGNVQQALMDTYPDIGLVHSRFIKKPRGYWEDRENRKLLFESISRKRNFNPLIPHFWYSLKLEDIIDNKDIFTVLNKYGGSLYESLKDVFPNITFEKDKFSFSSEKLWYHTSKKAFFDNFAKKRGFDSLIPVEWYNINKFDIMNEKGGGVILKDESLSEALIQTYPNIGLNVDSFKTQKRYWNVKENRRSFFEKVAQKMKFDPLVPSNWYSISNDIIINEKGGAAVLKHHGGSLSKSLLESFPSIGLDTNKFRNFSKLQWQSKEQKKRFFDDIARKRKFDPLGIENWLNLPLKIILSQKGGPSLLRQYGTILNAVKDLYHI